MEYIDFDSSPVTIYDCIFVSLEWAFSTEPSLKKDSVGQSRQTEHYIQVTAAKDSPTCFVREKWGR